MRHVIFSLNEYVMLRYVNITYSTEVPQAFQNDRMSNQICFAIMYAFTLQFKIKKEQWRCQRNAYSVHILAASRSKSGFMEHRCLDVIVLFAFLLLDDYGSADFTGL